MHVGRGAVRGVIPVRSIRMREGAYNFSACQSRMRKQIRMTLKTPWLWANRFY
jgi:hypothetical protein